VVIDTIGQPAPSFLKQEDNFNIDAKNPLNIANDIKTKWEAKKNDGIAQKQPELNPKATDELASISNEQNKKSELQKVEAQIIDAEEQFERGAVNWSPTSKLSHFKEIRNLKAKKDEPINVTQNSDVNNFLPTIAEQLIDNKLNVLTEYLTNKIDDTPLEPAITDQVDNKHTTLTLEQIQSKLEMQKKALELSETEKAKIEEYDKTLRDHVIDTIQELAQENKFVSRFEGVAGKTHEMWRKGWLVKLGASIGMMALAKSGEKVLETLGYSIPGLNVGILSVRSVMGAVGTTLGTEAILKANQAAKEVRKGGIANFKKSYVEATKVFFKTIFDKENKNKKLFGKEGKLNLANQAFRTEQQKIGFINDQGELDKELDRDLDSRKIEKSDENRLKLLEIKLMNLATLAKDFGLKDITEVAGAKKSIGVMIDGYVKLLGDLDNKKILKIKNPDTTPSEMDRKKIEFDDLKEILKLRNDRLKNIAKDARIKQTWDFYQRWTLSAVAGVFGIAASALWSSINHLRNHVESATEAATTAGVIKEVSKHQATAMAQEAAQYGELKATIPQSIFGTNIPVVEHDEHQWAQIDGKEYPYSTEGGKHFVYTRFDSDFDGKPESMDKLVKIDLNNGFGVDPNGHVVQAIDLHKSGINNNFGGILARHGSILYDANDKMINGQMWMEKDGYHASVIGKIMASQNVPGLNVTGIVFDQDNKLPEDLKDITGAKEIFDNKYEVEYLSAQNPQELANQYLHLYDPTHADTLHIAELSAKLSGAGVDLQHADIDKLNQINNPTNTTTESAINAGVKAVQEQIVAINASTIIAGLETTEGFKFSAECKKYLVEHNLLSDDWKHIDRAKEILAIKNITRIEDPTGLTLWINKATNKVMLIDTQSAKFDLGKEGVYSFSFKNAKNFINELK